MSEPAVDFGRRDFLRRLGSAALAGAAGAGSLLLAQEASPPAPDATGTASGPAAAAGAGEAAVTSPGAAQARVVLIRNRAVLGEGGRIDSRVLGRMLDEGVAALLSTDSPQAAWARLLRPLDVVGIKSNEWEFLPTPAEMEEILRARVLAAGVGEARVAVEDRGVLEHPLFREATALINVRPLRTHHWAGVGSCIKNYIMFAPEPSDWHGDSCADLAGLWDLPLVKGKTRLNVLLLLTPLFHSKGAHDFQSRYTWDYRGLIVGLDPVAVDATGLRILEARRREYFGENLPLTVSPKHIRVAEEKFHLGVADPARIEVVKLGWSDGALI